MTMDEEALNLSVRKFLKTLGVTAQREIERAAREAADGDRLKGRTSFPAKATLKVEGLDITFEMEGEIKIA
jgi:hypothetical protein